MPGCSPPRAAWLITAWYNAFGLLSPFEVRLMTGQPTIKSETSLS
jgi:hypothetical protein